MDDAPQTEHGTRLARLIAPVGRRVLGRHARLMRASGLRLGEAVAARHEPPEAAKAARRLAPVRLVTRAPAAAPPAPAVAARAAPAAESSLHARARSCRGCRTGPPSTCSATPTRRCPPATPGWAAPASTPRTDEERRAVPDQARRPGGRPRGQDPRGRRDPTGARRRSASHEPRRRAGTGSADHLCRRVRRAEQTRCRGSRAADAAPTQPRDSHRRRARAPPAPRSRAARPRPRARDAARRRPAGPVEHVPRAVAGAATSSHAGARSEPARPRRAVAARARGAPRDRAPSGR